MSLDEWLSRQYGPDKHYKSARALSLAVSGGRNANVVYDIEKRGYARIETLRKLAETLEVPILIILLCAGWLSESDLSLPEGRLTDDEREVLYLYRQTAPDLQRVMIATLRAASSTPDDDSQS